MSGFDMNQLTNILPIIIPLFVLDLILVLTAILSIVRKDEKELRFNNKLIWILIVVFINLIGPIIYFILGSKDDGGNDNGSNE
jgi:hypothetical protein